MGKPRSMSLAWALFFWFSPSLSAGNGLDSPWQDHWPIWTTLALVFFVLLLVALWVSIRSGRAVKANAQQLRQAGSVFHYSYDAICITDAQARILDVNKAFTEITGYEREEVLGKNPRLLRSGRQTKDFYQQLWTSLQEKGYWKGYLWNRHKNGREYAEQLTITAVQDGKGQVRKYVGIFRDATQERQQQLRLERLAHHDSLTGLPNRALLTDRLYRAMSQASRSGSQLVLAYLDLDGFKAVNDDHGHEAGDRLLLEMAHRMQACVRSHDTVARLGGDEFVLLLVDVQGQTECEQMLARIVQVLAAPCPIGEVEVQVSASLGAVIYPELEVEADQLLHCADQAMYRAKRAGKNRYHLYDPLLDDADQRQHVAESRVAQAQAQGEFELLYQPIVDLINERVAGIEALLYWRHPESGQLLRPEYFLPLMGGEKLAETLDSWALAELYNQQARWKKAGLESKLNLDISAPRLRSKGVLEVLRRQQQHHPGLEAGTIGLGVCETLALEDLDGLVELRSQCRDLGISVFLDGFGQGYSSLAFFRRLHVDGLKIAPTLVEDMLDDEEALALVESIIGLGRAFQLEVVAEGVVTPHHALALSMLGCRYAQGQGITSPMTANEIPGWLARFEPDPVWRKDQVGYWRREDLPLLIVAHYHDHWVSRVQDYLSQEGGDANLPTLNHEQCRFGRWYYGEGRRYSQMPEYPKIGDSHRQIHELALGLIDRHRQGDVEGIRDQLFTLMSVKSDLLHHVNALKERIHRQS